MILSFAAVVLHGVVLVKGVLYFTLGRDRRGDSQHIVAAVTAGSGLFLGGQWAVSMLSTHQPAIMAAFSLFNGVLYLALIESCSSARYQRKRPAHV